MERRLAEKDEEFEATRKNHQRAIESMQASLEAESKGRADALKSKKKLESDINELEVGLDGANRSRAEADKNIKKFQQQLRELQQQVSDFFSLKILYSSLLQLFCSRLVRIGAPQIDLGIENSPFSSKKSSTSGRRFANSC